MSTRPATPSLPAALPFWISLLLVPIAYLAATRGGLMILLLPVYGWVLFTLLDFVTGQNHDNADPETPDDKLFWYRLLTLVWAPIQLALLGILLWYAPQAAHLSLFEKFFLFANVGVFTGATGIVYAHELMHQPTRLERWLADILLATVLYSHFRSEHLLVHHRYVGTPRDAVTARFGEGFHHYFFRIMRECPQSAFQAEASKLARAGRSKWHFSNPFWRYGALQLAALLTAVALGGWLGLALFLTQAIVAIWELELTNYVEHYGLTREHLGDGKYEHVKPHHSWNAAHRATNWLLINLQRHSDHHYRPDRRFPLLQDYPEDQAPQLPFGYPAMTALALFPPRWRRFMNPRVRAWRAHHYPHITDWTAYNTGATPPPR